MSNNSSNDTKNVQLKFFVEIFQGLNTMKLNFINTTYLKFFNIKLLYTNDENQKSKTRH